MSRHPQKKAVITGATSGIGEAFARAFAEQGYDLIITGRRQDKINQVADNIRKSYPCNVHVIIIDLTDSEKTGEFIKRLQQEENIEILVNNAGFGMRYTFTDGEISTFEDMLRVHSTVPMKLMHAVIPGMKERESGIIINVSSTAGFFPLPRSAVYSASKSFLTVLSEALHIELKSTGIKVQALCPGMTRTDFHSKLGKDPGKFYRTRGVMKAMKSDEVVKVSLACLKKDKVVCVPGFNNKFLMTIPRLVPKSILYKLAALARQRDT